MTNAITVLADKLAVRFGMEADGEILSVLKATAFRGEKEITDAQMSALLIVANQYGLNPWTKEIYAFPDKRGGIVPVVGVDGWSRIINDHPAFDGMDFEAQEGEITCIIHRKDRSHPTRVTEYQIECQRKTDPWSTHPRRMLRHKAMIQCARLAFGFVGIYDRDEAERIIESAEVIDTGTGEIRQTEPVKTPQRKSQPQDAPQAPNESAEDVSYREVAPTPEKAAPVAAEGFINMGQTKYLAQKIASLELSDTAVDEMLTRHGIKIIDTTVTLDQFNALKKELLSL